ncbi:BamA/TamA family outer membrane protein [Candidatus Sumerlaeota bacterium]|nr:BamA/TamA family outer membrane protein [Candidatus Sumerlaeota bacterium]
MALFFRKIHYFIFIVFLSLLPVVVFAQKEPQVKEIVIEGLKTIDKETVLDVMRTRVGEPSSPEIRQEDIRSIYALGFFNEDIRFYREEAPGGIRVIVSLKENPVVEDIVITGNRVYKASRILARIPFKKGDILSPGSELKAKMEIEKIYSQGGYTNARIKVATEEIRDGAVFVNILVDEGEKITIRDLVLKGNKHYSSFRLRLLLENRGSWAFFKKYYDDNAFDEDMNVLRHFYRNRGFLDVVVKRGKPEYNEEEGWIRPVIIIEEGKRFRVKDVVPQNVTLFSGEEIKNCFSKMKDRFYNAKRYQKSMDSLRRLYGDEGYIRMEADADFRRFPDSDAIELVLNIRENNRIYVGRIRVRRMDYKQGKLQNIFEKIYYKISPPPKDEVIAREVILKPGEVYRTFEETRTVERLKRLEIFEEVSITREPTDNPDVRDVMINTREGVTGNLLLGVGYGDATGAYIQSRFRERNLFGDARDFQIRALIGTKLSALHLSYLDRYFLQSETSLEWRVYREKYLRREYGERIYGTSAELGRSLSEYIRGYFRLRLEHVNFYDEDDDITSDLDNYVVVAGRFRAVEDTRDENWWPTKGFVRGGALELGYADGPLARLSMDYAQYVTLYKDIIFAVDFFGGLIPYPSDEVGITERFFLGGSSDLRGFSFRGAGSKDEGEDNMAVGGSSKLLLKNEIRYPIYGDLKGVVFGDIGTLDETVHLGSFRTSVGAGIRLKISIITISVDFAYAIRKKRADDAQIVHFRLGTTF